MAASDLQCCPLCESIQLFAFHQDRHRAYYRCRQCQLVFVPQKFHLSQEAEQSLYQLHENDLADPGYRQFLSRFAEPFMGYLPANAKGLDFGCGPGPLLANMLIESGRDVALYDPYFFPDAALLNKQYDFVMATEVIEHFNNPKHSIALLISLVKKGGYLGVMSKLVKDQEAFQNWHYIRDPTHVSFFSVETYQFLCDRYSLRSCYLEKDVAIFQVI
jgi:SAM-dependent methyltransferase